MHVAGLWRYPVKSMQGEELEAADIDTDGLRHDRAWGIRSMTSGLVLTARRRPELLLASARLEGDRPHITLPDGTTATGVGPPTDSALSAWLDEPVSLVAAADVPEAVGEFFADATDDTSPAIRWTMPAGRFVDAQPVLLLTDAALRAAAELYPDGDWDVRRIRPNIVAAGAPPGWAEDGWVERTVAIGAEAAIAPVAPCQRCTMVTRPQPGLRRDLDIYRTLLRHHGGTLGVWSAVRRPGPVRLGDAVEVDGAH